MTPAKPFLPQLQSYIEGEFVVAGVGNELKGLDRVGIDIARRGRELYPEKFIDCGVAPENYLDQIINQRVKTVIVVDAVFYEDREEAKIFLPEELSMQGISTHSLSLKLVAEYLRNHGIKTVIVGIRPDSDLEKTGEKVLSRLLQLLKDT